MNDAKEYWHGSKCKIIRYWFYINRGNDVLNQFHSLFYLILGLYWVLKIHNHWWLIGMFFIIIPILLVVGYVQVHHIGRVVEWLNIKFSTHYGQLGYEYQKQMIARLEEILKALKNEE